MRRRLFVQALASLGISLSFTDWERIFPDPRIQVLAEPELLGMLKDHDKVVTLGEKYSRQNQFTDAEEVLMELEKRLAPLPRDKNRLQERIRECVRQDFEHAEWEIVDGWVLSRTELNQCALLSLIQA